MKPNDIAWFRPLWRRIAVTGFLAIWCLWEWLWNEPFWGVLTGAGLAYALYNFFHAFPKEDKAHEQNQSPHPPDRDNGKGS